MNGGSADLSHIVSDGSALIKNQISNINSDGVLNSITMLNHHSSISNSDTTNTRSGVSSGGISSSSSSISSSNSNSGNSATIGAIIPPLGTNTNQHHGFPGIDISGFQFPSGFTFGGTLGSMMTPKQQQHHADFNELTASFPPPSVNQLPKHNNMHQQQQFDTYSIDGSSSNNNDNNHHLHHHHHLSSDNIGDSSNGLDDDVSVMLHFGTDNNTIVTSQTGSMALLPCIVNNIGDGMVSIL